MSHGAFALTAADLPRRLPVFPLTGVLLLPGGHLPLNVFEPRYLAMTQHALGRGRFIGMIQPVEGAGDAGDPPLCRTGCMGRIVEFRETEDGRFLITLVGCARFDVAAEPPREDLFRTIVPDWSRWTRDLEDDAPDFDRERLIAALQPYFQRTHIKADMNALGTAPADRIVIALSMLCPFSPREKQALLEAADATARAQLLTGLIEMAARAGDDGGAIRH